MQKSLGQVVGREAFDNPFVTSLFLGIKIWKKTQKTGLLAAVVILWGKNPVTQNIALLTAVD